MLMRSLNYEFSDRLVKTCPVITKLKNTMIRKILALLLIFTPEPSLAIATINPLPIESEPCQVIILPNGGKACVPKVAQADCLKVGIRQNGKIIQYIIICDKPRVPVASPTPKTQPTKSAGY